MKIQIIKKSSDRFWLCCFFSITSSYLYPTSSSLFATSKGGAATKNNRDSRPKHLGVKKYGGEFVLSGNILVRQRGTPFRAGEGVIRTGDDTLVATTAGYVCMHQTYKNSNISYSGGRRRSNNNNNNNNSSSSRRRRIKGACVVSIKPLLKQTRDEKAEKVGLLRTLAYTWIQQENTNTFLEPSSYEDIQ